MRYRSWSQGLSMGPSAANWIPVSTGEMPLPQPTFLGKTTDPRFREEATAAGLAELTQLDGVGAKIAPSREIDGLLFERLSGIHTSS